MDDYKKLEKSTKALTKSADDLTKFFKEAIKSTKELLVRTKEEPIFPSYPLNLPALKNDLLEFIKSGEVKYMKDYNKIVEVINIIEEAMDERLS